MNAYAQAVLVTSIIFSIIAAVLTGARIWARRITRRPLQANDYIIIGNTVRLS